MLIYFDQNRKIIAYDDEKTQMEAEAILQNNPACVWYEEDFSFFMGEDRPGFEKAFYLETDGTIHIEYEEIPLRLPTPEEVIQAKLDYLMMMAG